MPHNMEGEMANKKELSQLYGGRKPKSYLPAHNQVIHTLGFAHGLNGFRRFWIPPQWVGHGWAKCPCGWRGHQPEWKTHYAHSGHVKWWKSEIKKRGSLEAVYRHIIERLATADHQRGLKRGLWDHVLEQMGA
jgi:hypothetical protein